MRGLVSLFLQFFHFFIFSYNFSFNIIPLLKIKIKTIQKYEPCQFTLSLDI